MISFQDALSALVSALGSLATGPVGFAFVALAAAGSISMALVQVIKEVTPLRTRYQERWFMHWIYLQEGAFKCATTNVSTSVETKPTLSEVAPSVIALSTGGMRSALYDLAAEEMVAQMKQIIPIILDEPKTYPAALIRLSLGASTSDLKLILAGQPSEGAAHDYFDARARVTRRMERSLDGVRIALSDRWRLWMQLASLAATTLVVQLAVGMSAKADWSVHLLAIPVGIVGGYFAPVMRDLLAVLQRLAKP